MTDRYWYKEWKRKRILNVTVFLKYADRNCKFGFYIMKIEHFVRK